MKHQIGNRVRWENHFDSSSPEPIRTGKIKDIYKDVLYNTTDGPQYTIRYLIAPDHGHPDFLWNGRYPKMEIIFDGNDILKEML